MQKTITSVQNPYIKKLLSLQEKSRERRKQGIFLIEGRKEISLAKPGGYYFKEVLYCPDIFPELELDQLIGGETPRTVVSKEVYQKLAYRNSTEGVLVVATSRDHSLNALHLPKNPLILVAEAPEKPGNLGAMLRTADAAAVDAVIIANPRTDLYNPNIIRSSLGTVFTHQIATDSTENVIAYLQQNQCRIFAASLEASISYLNVDFQGASAIVVGTENSGLTKAWLEASSQNIVIPMQGAIDSMNVSVSAAILIFEAVRQRALS